MRRSQRELKISADEPSAVAQRRNGTTASLTNRTARMRRILDRLDQVIPLAQVELNHRSVFELLVATILSAQCTDERVNQVTPALFAKYRRPENLAMASPPELESIIHSTGFYKAKANNLMRCAQMLVERFGGVVPETMEELVTLPGVGRKTANVILGNWYGKPGVVVDTHVKRVSNRLGFSSQSNPDLIERDLQETIPVERWTSGAQRLLLHGRYVCVARNPRCVECEIQADCQWEGKVSA